MRVCKLLAGMLLTVSAGCVNTDVIVQKQGEMERRLESVAQSGVLHTQRTDDLAAQLVALQQSHRESREEIETLKKVILGLRADMTLHAQPKGGDISRIEVVNRESGDRQDGPPAGYVTAFGLYSANDYAGAIEGFDAFIRANPGSEYAGNARYWMGECHYARQEYEKARATFQSVVDEYPSSSKVPDAMLKVAYSLLAMNDQAQGAKSLRELILKHPDSQAAAKARDRLNSMNGSMR